jgi:hypothetical protein
VVSKLSREELYFLRKVIVNFNWLYFSKCQRPIR